MAQRKLIKACQICNQVFSFKLKEHQCKRCLRAVCRPHGDAKDYIYTGNTKSKKMHRVCINCQEEAMLNKIILKQLNFSQSSSFMVKWIKSLRIRNSNPDLKNIGYPNFQKYIINALETINFSTNNFLRVASADI